VILSWPVAPVFPKRAKMHKLGLVKEGKWLKLSERMLNQQQGLNRPLKELKRSPRFITITLVCKSL